MQNENESLKAKLAKISQENQQQILELQKELGETSAINERLTRYIRELEQSNDDLERAKRALAASLDDFEGRLNHQIERNVLLENELGEKEELEGMAELFLNFLRFVSLKGPLLKYFYSLQSSFRG